MGGKTFGQYHPTVDFVDPASVSVIAVMGKSSKPQPPSLPPEKKLKKDKAPAKSKKPSASYATDDKMSALDQKWSECLNRLEALL